MSELVMFYAENRALVLVLAGQHMNLALSAVADCGSARFRCGNPGSSQ